jgi:eukaryotic-like serine/threonine-protein kinase
VEEVSAGRQYQLLQKIATGGMAEVYLATLMGPEGFRRRVVIKKILRRWAHNADVLSLFRDEARIGSRLDHHNVVQVLDYGRSGDDTFLVLEYVEGRNQAELIAAAADQGHYLPATTCTFVAAECCGALDHIHSRTDRTGEHLGVVHRDINPANVLISHSGEVKLTDFGVAAGLHRELQTAHGILRGTFPYMSPEQTFCRPVDGRSDIFSVGICLYEALTAQHPFAEDEDYLTIKNIQQMAPPPPDHLRGDLDPALCAIVMRCLEKDPANRYNTAHQLQDDLVGWLRVKRATYGAGRLSRIMAECFPIAGPPGVEVEPQQITLGPTTPGSGNPLLDLSLLDSRKIRRIGGAIEPQVSDPGDAIPVDPYEDEDDDPTVKTRTVDDIDPFAELEPPPVIRAPSVVWDQIDRRAATHEDPLPPPPPPMPQQRGPVSMDGIRKADYRRPGRFAWAFWLAVLAGLATVVFYAFTGLS